MRWDINRRLSSCSFWITWFMLHFKRMFLTACLPLYFVNFFRGCGDSWRGLRGDAGIGDIRIASATSHRKCLNCGHRDTGLGRSHLIPEDKIGWKQLPHKDAERTSGASVLYVLQGTPLKMPHFSWSRIPYRMLCYPPPVEIKHMEWIFFRSLSFIFYIFSSLRFLDYSCGKYFKKRYQTCFLWPRGSTVAPMILCCQCSCSCIILSSWV